MLVCDHNKHENDKVQAAEAWSNTRQMPADSDMLQVTVQVQAVNKHLCRECMLAKVDGISLADVLAQ